MRPQRSDAHERNLFAQKLHSRLLAEKRRVPLETPRARFFATIIFGQPLGRPLRDSAETVLLLRANGFVQDHMIDFSPPSQSQVDRGSDSSCGRISCSLAGTRSAGAFVILQSADLQSQLCAEIQKMQQAVSIA